MKHQYLTTDDIKQLEKLYNVMDIFPQFTMELQREVKDICNKYGSLDKFFEKAGEINIVDLLKQGRK